MVFFEFLIQREGDRSWLPIESSEVEILEGRYRIVGRSQQANYPVDIQINYFDLEALPPRRRTHKRMGKTNAQGLVAVMSFTSLHSGNWEILCSGYNDARQTNENPTITEIEESESSGNNTWHRKIQLQVLEENAHHIDDFEPEFADVAPNEIVADTSAVHINKSGNDAFQLEVNQPEQKADSLEQSSQSDVANSIDSPLSEHQQFHPDTVNPDTIESHLPPKDAAGQDTGSMAIDMVNTNLSEAGRQATDMVDTNVAEQINTPVLEKPEAVLFLDELPQSPDLITSSQPNASHIDSATNDEGKPKQAISSEEAVKSKSTENTTNTPQWAIPKSTSSQDLPIDIEGLSPDIRDDIESAFQAVDAIAEEILASLEEEITTTHSTYFNDALINLEDKSDELEDKSDEQPIVQTTFESTRPLSSSAMDDSGNSEVLMPSATSKDLLNDSVSGSNPALEGREASPVQVVGLPSLQIVLDQGAWSLRSDRPLSLTGSIKENDEVPFDWDTSPLNLMIQLTNPQNGTLLYQNCQSICLNQGEVTPFNETITTIHPTQAHLILGEVKLSTTAPNNASQSIGDDSSFVLATQVFVVVLEPDPLSEGKSSPNGSPLKIQSTPAGPSAESDTRTRDSLFLSEEPFEEPFEELFDVPINKSVTSEQSAPLDPNSLQTIGQSTLASHLHPVDSGLFEKTAPDSPNPDRPNDEQTEQQSHPDLPSFVKSPTSLASSILGLAGLSSDLFMPEKRPTERSQHPSTEKGSTSEKPNNDSRESVGNVRDNNSQTLQADALNMSDDNLQNLLNTLMQEVKESDVNTADTSNYLTDPSQDTTENDLKANNLEAAIRDIESKTSLTLDDQTNPFVLWDEDEGSIEADLSINRATNVSDHLVHQFIPEDFDETHELDYIQHSGTDISSESQDIFAESAVKMTADVQEQDGLGEKDLRSESLTDESLVDEINPSTTSMQNLQRDQSLIKTGQTNTEPPSPISTTDEHTDSSRITPLSEDTTTEYPTLPNDIDVPTPSIHHVDEELVAGQPFPVSITIPNLGSRIFVKLWIQDRHTRMLLDGPRWLADFITIEDHTLEARTELTIPLGTMEVRIEAIAMEMMTQRESRKISLERSVVPPEISRYSFDDDVTI